ncbi:MAG TPA: alkaline phosphatase family protein [Gaiellaceae bacterium]|nr:alkaline phosphatase family protein [Gaiellaceae bacterium]
MFVIMLENHSEDSVIDRRAPDGSLLAPYMTQLAHTYAWAKDYYGVTHPSEPNYVASIAGSTRGLQEDDPTYRSDAPNIVDQLEARGLARARRGGRWSATASSGSAPSPTR